MTIETDITPTDGAELHEDPVALARAVMSGRSLKRGPLNQLLKQLVELATAPRDVPPAPLTMLGPPPSIAANNPCTLPGVLGAYDVKSPFVVQDGPGGSVFLGPNANRWYTNREACGLIGELIRKTGGTK